MRTGGCNLTKMAPGLIFIYCQSFAGSDLLKTDNTELYRSAPVHKAVIALAVPTIISQLITVVYNMADTFFVGQLGDPRQVAAATLSLPVFIFITGIANLFGIGGASLISRSLGSGNYDKARSASAFSVWSSVAIALTYGLLVMLLRPSILPLIGAKEDTYDYCFQYLFWTVCVGSVPTVLNAELAHLVRSEGYSRQASFGVAGGGILNIILDPVFIFVFRLGIKGAAIATMLSNVAATAYFVIFFIRNRKKLTITLDPRRYSVKDHIPAEIITVGLPSFLMSIMAVLSNAVLNKLISSHATEAVAGIGIAKKIDSLAFAIANGMTQGVLSLIGYNYASGNRKRMFDAIKTSFLYSIILALGGALFLFLCAAPVSRFFINDPLTVHYGQRYLRIIATTCPAVAITFMVITIFQATGKRIQPLCLSFLRKGGIDIPAMFVFDKLLGADGIPWATPFADYLALFISAFLFFPYWKKLHQTDDKKTEQL